MQLEEDVRCDAGGRPHANRTELLSTGAIRERCANVTRAVEAGALERISASIAAGCNRRARIVAEVTRRRYRDLAIPYHSRWRHFDAGRFSRVSELNRQLACYSPQDRLRAQIDLAVISVLLDAGAGAALALPRARHDRRLLAIRRSRRRDAFARS